MSITAALAAKISLLRLNEANGAKNTSYFNTLMANGNYQPNTQVLILICRLSEIIEVLFCYQ